MDKKISVYFIDGVGEAVKRMKGVNGVRGGFDKKKVSGDNLAGKRCRR